MDQYSSLIIVAIIGIWILYRNYSNRKIRINPEEAKQKLDSAKGIVLLDVRTQEEYQEKRIPKSISVPLNLLQSQAPKKLPNKDAEILVYCRSGNRSAAAVRILSKLGYSNVKNIGGIIHWPYETISGKKG